MDLFAFVGLFGLSGVQRQPRLRPAVPTYQGYKPMLTQLRTNSAPRPGFDNEVHGLSRSQRTAILGSIDQHSRSGEEDGQSRHCPPGPLSDFRAGEFIRNEFVYGSLSQGNRVDTDRISRILG